LSSAYHPQANGLTERFNKTLCESLAKTASQFDKQWDLFIHASLFAYRTSQHAITQQTPFFLVYGRQPRLPVELQINGYPERSTSETHFQDDVNRRVSDLIGITVETRITAKEKIKLSQDLQKLRHDKKIKNRSFTQHDQVLEFRSQDQNIYGDKMTPKWDGPFVVHHVMGKGSYILRKLDGTILQNRPVHGNQLKKYFPPDQQEEDIKRSNFCLSGLDKINHV